MMFTKALSLWDLNLSNRLRNSTVQTVGDERPVSTVSTYFGRNIMVSTEDSELKEICLECED